MNVENNNTNINLEIYEDSQTSPNKFLRFVQIRLFIESGPGLIYMKVTEMLALQEQDSHVGHSSRP